MDKACLTNLSIFQDIRRIRAHDLARSVRFYLAVGCEARLSGDGWVQLCSGDTLFMLEHGDTNAPSGRIAPELNSRNLLHLCRRLWAAGIDTSPISYPAWSPAGRITTSDPDRHPLSISQAESR